MNCIDHPHTRRPMLYPFAQSLAIVPLAMMVLFTAFGLDSASPAHAGPHFSIPGLQTLQRKFTKKRRRKKEQQRETDEPRDTPLRENWESLPPPALPVRNPRHVAMEKHLATLRIIDPNGFKRAIKAEQTLRAQSATTSRKTSKTSSSGKNDRAKVKKKVRDGSTPTKWLRPQRVQKKPEIVTPIPVRNIPSPRALDKSSLDKSDTNKSVPQQLAISLPPLPTRKPRRHPSQMIEKDWSEAVIKSATAQCVTLGITIKPLAPVKKGRCGNPAPIIMPAIGSATIRPAATLSCPMAANLNRWFLQSVQPLALAYFGQKITKIRNVSSYVCRNRYGDTTTRISEHAFANALDIADLELEGGEKISVLDDWQVVEGEPSKKSDFLHALHKSACKLFGTVLGPDANAAHKDHFHLDAAPRKRSNYCR